jgi:hypothetical protein
MARIISLNQASTTLLSVGVEAGDYIRLVRPNTQFVDKDTGFRISGDQVKLLPNQLSQKMVAAIRAGRFKVVKKADLAREKKGKGSWS